jgi:TRAP-type C4-dicarboxylate transport system permease small subunit
MNKKFKRALVIAIPLLAAILSLFAMNQFGLAYSNYSWKILAAVYPLPPITIYLPIIMH